MSNVNETIEEIKSLKTLLEKHNITYEEYLMYRKLLTLEDIATSLEKIDVKLIDHLRRCPEKNQEF